MPQRLRSRLALVLAVAMAPAGALAVLQALAGAEQEVRQRDAVFASEMRATALKQRDALLQVRNQLAAAADAAESAYLGTEECGPVLERLTLQRYFSRAVLLDRQGRVVCGSSEWKPLRHVSDWEGFVADPGARFTVPERGAETAMWPVVALHPTVFMRPEAFAVAAEVDLAYLRALDLQGFPTPAYGVVDATGGLIAEADHTAMGWMPREPGAILGRSEQAVSALSQRGAERLYITQPLIEDQLWAVASMPKTTVLDVIASPGGVAVIGPILLWLIAIGVAYLSIDRLVTRHVSYLGRATALIGRGELDTEIRPLHGAPSEIRALGDAIRDMARNLQERESEMRDLIEHQKSLILEIHHRVKNNLQMVTSLINIQLRRARTADERQALRFLEDRIQSLAIVHHHLYGTEEIDRIELGELVRDICERLKLSMSPVAAKVGFRYDLGELVVDSRVATPVALFLTEAISNVFKHAVPPTGRHEIGVSLWTSGPRFVLEIRNEMAHVAVPAAQAGERQRLGMRLLRSFAAQLDGSFEKIVDDHSFRLVLSAPIMPRGAQVVTPAFATGAVR